MAGLLQLVLSFFWVPGVGRLYAGNTGLGLVQLLGFWGCCLLTLVLLPLTALFLPLFLIPGLGALGIWLWAVVDGIMILVGTVRDGQGRKLRS
ncbi:hypothetical protein P9209_17555 [Prescottella defluvii]|nr:hypothetical protein P9209_17555 [Prescottella defluvii]